MYEKCSLCARECLVNRKAGERGFCGMTDKIHIARADLHAWEEPPISGERGSGTVFFSGCSLGCIYCQNRQISRNEVGREVSGSELADIFIELEKKGAHNVNLVTPTHYINAVVEALMLAKPRLSIPVVYNCGGYESVESLGRLDGLVDIYLPDLKYFSSELSAKYSAAPDYFEVASAALSEMRS